MKLKRISLLSLVTLLILVVGCQSESDDKPLSKNKRPIQLVGEVNTATRVSGSSWDDGDRIGVFGRETNQTWNQGLLSELDNQAFVTTEGNGVFTTSESIHYPEGKKIDLVAYYPYQQGVTNFIYKINLQDQSIFSNLDLLYSNNVKSIGEEDALRPTLQFERQLAMLTLNVYPEGKVGVLKPEQIEKITLEGLATTADFSLETGELSNRGTVQSVPLSASYLDKHLLIETLLIPGSDLTQAKVVIKTKGGLTYSFSLQTAGNITAIEKGKNYTYPLELNGTIGGEEEQEPEPTNGGFTEWPNVENSKFNAKIAVHYLSNSTRANGAIRNFTLYYDPYYKISHWVAYPLHPYYTEKITKRTDRWQYDPIFPSKDQPNLKSAWADYNRLKYDRGHQIASADRLCTKEANEQTFYYTNMTPQKADLNQKKWADLEGQVRKWSDRFKEGVYDTLFVVTGAIIPTAPEKVTWAKDKSGGQAAIPTAYYKVLLQNKDGKNYTIGFRLNNEFSPNALSSYEVTVAKLEEETGFTFFPSLTKAEKESIDRSFWRY